MGSSGKKRRRKEEQARNKAEKREKRERAIRAMQAFHLGANQLELLDSKLERVRKRDKGKTNAGGRDAPPGQQQEEVHGRGAIEVCDIDQLEEDTQLPGSKPPPRNEEARKSADLANANANAGRAATHLMASTTHSKGSGKSARKQMPAQANGGGEPARLTAASVRHADRLKTSGIKGKLQKPNAKSDSTGGTSSGKGEGIGNGPEQSLENAKPKVLPHYVVHVLRDEKTQSMRQELPICGMEQEIVEAINENPIVLVCGETGCGKTTQVPQFLYEAGYGTSRTKGRIGITQPRRIAASSTAERVAFELNSKMGDKAGYQVRYDQKIGRDTVLKFMTDGILMRELQEDALLRQYSVIVLDEVHERNLNTDVILGFLTRIIPLRERLDGVEPLKLVVMSATLAGTEFSGNNATLFRPPNVPPFIDIPAKRFPVTVHFSRRTEMHSYLHAAYKKVAAIHRKLPKGGVLVFVTGQREVLYLTKKLQARLGSARGTLGKTAGKSDDSGTEAFDLCDGDAAEDFSESEEGESDLENESGDERNSDDESQSDREELPGTVHETSNRPQEGDAASSEDCRDVLVIPLYAKLTAEQQAKVFTKPPDGARLIVVSTNVAETSITIPGIRYVVDTGRSKQKVTRSVHSGLIQFEVDWIAKSSATQRAGRAGRTGPGHCYRLYSSAHYNDNFRDHATPDIQNTPLEAVVLQLKSIGVDRPDRFPFPTMPNLDSLRRAETCLRLLGAVEQEGGPITGVGRSLARFPINPRHARMIMASVGASSPKTEGKCLQMAIAVAAILSFENPIATTSRDSKAENAGNDDKKQVAVLGAEELSSIGQRFGGEVFATLHLLRAYEEQAQADSARLNDFCRENNLHSTIMKEIVQLKRQIANVCTFATSNRGQQPLMLEGECAALARAINSIGGKSGLQDLTPLPSSRTAVVIQRAICTGWSDRVACRVEQTAHNSLHSSSSSDARGSTRKGMYRTLFGEEAVVLRKRCPVSRNRPQFVVYRDLVQGKKIVHMECVTEIQASWLSEVLKPLCTFSDPLIQPEPEYCAEEDTVYCWAQPTLGRYEWALPACRVEATDAATRSKAFLVSLLAGKAFDGSNSASDEPSPATLRDYFSGIAKSSSQSYFAAMDSGHPGLVLALQSLEHYRVYNRRTFERACCLRKCFLADELAKCVRKDRREDFVSTWTRFCNKLGSHV